MHGTQDARSPVPIDIERRRYPRIAILEQLHSQFVSLNVPVLTCDVSAGGFAIKAPVAFPEGDIHEFLFTRDDGVSLLVTGRAAHSRPVVGPTGTPAHLTGFDFVLDDARTRRAVENLIEHLRSAPDVV
jgi:hypothetical protein